MSTRPFNVLFLCTGNSARSIMAEAILNKLGAGKFRAYSAGSQPKGRVNPHTVQLLQSLGYDTSGFRSKSWSEFANPGAPALDFVFTVCDNAAGETCPVWPGQPMTAHWGIPDPAEAKGSPAEVALAFKDAYRMLSQRAFCEALGTAFLLAAVVGSGIMAQKLAGGNDALALLCNTLPTGCILAVLILIFGPLSGAHLNPAVSLAFALRGKLAWPTAAVYIVTQVLGGIGGVWMAHLMFELPVWQFAITARTGPGQWLAEAVATFGHLLTIFGCVSHRPESVPYA